MNAKPKLVVLDGYTAVFDDLDWRAFDAIADAEVYQRTPPDKIIERAANADAVFTNKVPLFRGQLDALPKLKYIGVLATGYNNVDIPLARSRGITVTNIPSYGTESVAQQVFAHILNMANRVADHAASVRAGAWCSSKDICYCLTRQTELSGLTLGIVGYGAIGRAAARIGAAFGMKVLACRRSGKIGEIDGCAQIASLGDVLAKSDIVSLNCPLNEKTDKIINAQTIAKMKRGAWLVNTGRGGLVDEPALAAALKSGQIAFAGVDVLSSEPPKPDNPLLGLENCFITPHNAWTTTAARRRLLKICFDNFAAWLAGSPINTVK